MSRDPIARRLWTLVLLGVAGLGSPDVSPARAAVVLPAFTEEREAAALQFVRKHAPELLPVLEKLKNADLKKYREEISELFQVTEFLAELRLDNEKRSELELEIWKTETRATLLIAQISNPSAELRAKYEKELAECARKLVELDMEVLRLRIEELDVELRMLRDEESRWEKSRDTLNKERYQKLFDQAKKLRMM
jgi:hypothetical protein